MIVEFERHLRGTNLAENTVKSYLFAVRQFHERYDSVTKSVPVRERGRRYIFPALSHSPPPVTAAIILQNLLLGG